MTAKYLRPEDYDRSSHWISLSNLLMVISDFESPEDVSFETNDLSDINVFMGKECIGYIELNNGEGRFIFFKNILDK